MADLLEDSEPVTPRRGRSNAIVTYETLADIQGLVREALIKIDHMHHTLAAREEAHKDHEVRIRALELSHAAVVAANARASAIWTWAVPVLLSVVTTIVSVLTFAKYLGKS